MVSEKKTGAMKELKGAKVTCRNVIVVEMSKNGVISIIVWLLSIFNRYMGSGVPL